MMGGRMMKRREEEEGLRLRVRLRLRVVGERLVYSSPSLLIILPPSFCLLIFLPPSQALDYFFFGPGNRMR